MKVLRNLQGKSKRIPKTALSITSTQTTDRVYNFGSFSLNAAEQQLLRNSKAVPLPPKAFAVLLVLIQNRGCLVTKDRLLAEVWPDVFVEEANLTVNIAYLRKVLAAGDAERPCIETVPKRGYRFVAGVSEFSYPNSLAVLPFKNEGCGQA